MLQLVVEEHLVMDEARQQGLLLLGHCEASAPEHEQSKEETRSF
jgi:hypothetical protein